MALPGIKQPPLSRFLDGPRASSQLLWPKYMGQPKYRMNYHVRARSWDKLWWHDHIEITGPSTWPEDFDMAIQQGAPKEKALL